MYIIFIFIFKHTAKTFTEFIPNYNNIQFTQNINSNSLIQELNNEKAKNKKLEEEIQNLKNKYNIQTSELNKLRLNIQNLTNINNNLIVENNNLKIKLSNSNQFNQINQNNVNEINKLKEIINKKDKEINELKLQIPKKYVNMKDIMVINFLSTDQLIRCGIPCLSSDTFAEVEEKLYQQFDEFRNTNNVLLFKGNTILRFKKVIENNIRNGDTIQVVKPE